MFYDILKTSFKNSKKYLMKFLGNNIIGNRIRILEN